LLSVKLLLSLYFGDFYRNIKKFKLSRQFCFLQNNVVKKYLPLAMCGRYPARFLSGLEQCPGQGLGVELECALVPADYALEDMFGGIANKLNALGQGFGDFDLFLSSIAEV
jgi:hypothetical protein